MRQAIHRLAVDTAGKGLTDLTRPITRWLADQTIATGVLTVFCRHTSASLVIQENADPDVARDLASFFERIAPESGDYVHRSEGPDDMPSHIRSALTHASLAIPVDNGAMTLGTWQGVFLFEHRRRKHRREVVLHLIGE